MQKYFGNLSAVSQLVSLALSLEPNIKVTLCNGGIHDVNIWELCWKNHSEVKWKSVIQNFKWYGKMTTSTNY